MTIISITVSIIIISISIIHISMTTDFDLTD